MVINDATEIRVSEIGEFIRFQSCERRFKLGLDNRRLARAIDQVHLQVTSITTSITQSKIRRLLRAHRPDDIGHEGDALSE